MADLGGSTVSKTKALPAVVQGGGFSISTKENSSMVQSASHIILVSSLEQPCNPTASQPPAPPPPQVLECLPFWLGSFSLLREV